MKAYKQNTAEVITSLQTDSVTGLSHQEALHRLDQYGQNKAHKGKPFSFFVTFLEQLREPLILLLAASGVVIFFAGDAFDACIIVGIIALNTCIGTFQERRIAHMVEGLRTFQKQQSTVVREGVPLAIDDQLLVPGDIIIMQEGDHVPADARILEAYTLSVDEAVLTGESEPVVKIDTVYTQDMALSEQQNMLFSGSHIVTGYVRAVVVATGACTVGRALMPDIQLISSDMPLQKDLATVLKFILWLIVFICISLFCIGMWAGKPFPELLAALIALFMCVVPQGLPVIMTLILVSGAYVMARHGLVVKRLQALEALGRAQVVLVDKTGTLTKNELMVTSVVTPHATYAVTGTGYQPEGAIVYEGKVQKCGGSDVFLELLLEIALLLDRSLLTYSHSKKKYVVRGSVNEAALAVCAKKYGLSSAHLQAQHKNVYEIPFNAQHQYHAVFYETKTSTVAYVVGSPEVIVKRSVGNNPLLQKALETATQTGMRVLVAASKKIDGPAIDQSGHVQTIWSALLDDGLEPIGFFCMQDTLREGAREVVQTMTDAGIKVVMASGDNQKTAYYSAQQAGITEVHARTLPADKAHLVKMFQEQGKVVAMIGDGVNDVPALSLADVSIAMGCSGSELAKDAAHIIVVDDAFNKIAEGIAYGRHIFYTFKRVILYFFTTNFAEVLVMLFALAGGYPVPLLASQILWLNLVTDGFLDTALALEPVEQNTMRASWLLQERSLLTRGLAAQVVYIAVLGASLSFGAFAWYMPLGLAKARTIAMVTLTCCQWITALNCRSLDLSLFSLPLLSNRWLALALGGILITQIALLYIPFLQAIFKTVPLQGTDWAVVGSIAFILLLTEEVRKYVKRFYKRVN